MPVHQHRCTFYYAILWTSTHSSSLSSVNNWPHDMDYFRLNICYSRRDYNRKQTRKIGMWCNTLHRKISYKGNGNLMTITDQIVLPEACSSDKLAIHNDRCASPRHMPLIQTHKPSADLLANFAVNDLIGSRIALFLLKYICDLNLVIKMQPTHAKIQQYAL